MASAPLRDLEKFVAAIKDESREVLASQLSGGEDEALEGGNEVEEGEEEGGHGFITVENGSLIYEDSDGSVMMEEIDCLVREEETFTEPLDETDDEVIRFLSTFDVEKKTGDISQLLKENPEPLQLQFGTLVPAQISYKEFWERYYYRCDADRIQRQWDKAQEAARKTREEAITNTVQRVKNLFGGAVKAVSSTLQTAADGVDTVTAAPFGSMPPRATVASAGIFCASERPLFVMDIRRRVDDDEEEKEFGCDGGEEDIVEDDDCVENESEGLGWQERHHKNEEIEKLTEQHIQVI